MSGELSTAWTVAALVGAGLLFVVDLALSVALTASSALSRVALHRIGSESNGTLEFLGDVQEPSSAHRLAAGMLRQLCLLGAVLLLVLAARAAGLAWPALAGVGAGAVVGVLLVESLVARAIALRNPRKILRGAAVALRLAHFLLYPLARPLQRFLERAGSKPAQTEEEREEEQEEEVEALIEVGEREGLLEAEEGEMMRGIVDLDETRVREIMTPRTDIVALPVETSVAEARGSFVEAGHSRVPVYSGSIDNVVGVLHARDLFRAWADRKEEHSVSAFLRPATFVPETLSAAELLAEMRERTHLAVVVDEYGGVAGLVTIEDLLEEIVGEIRDEHEGKQDLVRREADGSWVINAVAHVKELETLFGVEFEERDFDTVGGMVVAAFGRLPASGERVEVRGLRVEVLQADRRRVQSVRVRPQREPESADAS